MAGVWSSSSGAAEAAPPWTLVHTVNPTGYNQLLGVDGTSPGDIWAVGLTGINSSLVEHWDGTSWVVVPDAGGGLLFDVDAIAADDVWAVGGSEYPDYQPVIEHWDGSDWLPAQIPQLGSAGVTSVSAVASDDVWAVGWYSNYPDGGALYLHWDGARWSQVVRR